MAARGELQAPAGGEIRFRPLAEHRGEAARGERFLEGPQHVLGAPRTHHHQAVGIDAERGQPRGVEITTAQTPQRAAVRAAQAADQGSGKTARRRAPIPGHAHALVRRHHMQRAARQTAPRQRPVDRIDAEGHRRGGRDSRAPAEFEGADLGA